MRMIEGLIFTVVAPASLWLFISQLPGWLSMLIVVAAILVLLHAWLEGMHWQLAPAYIAVVLLLSWVLSETNGHWHAVARPYFSVTVCFLLSASLFFSWALPMFKLPKPTGRLPIGTRILHLTDPNRAEMHAGARPGNREVVVQLWYPAAAKIGRKANYRMRKETTRISSYQAVLATHAFQDAPLAAGRHPLIIYNPAWHGFRQRGTALAQELASHGFAIAALSHPYNSSMVTLSDGTAAQPDYGQDLGFSLAHYISLEERLAMADEELIVQNDDCRFVLDELERLDKTVGHPLEGHLQTDRVGTYGYSFGGAVSMEFARDDPRVSSALELDGVLHGVAAKDGLDKPFLLIDSPLIAAWEDSDDATDIREYETAKMWKGIEDIKVDVLSRCGGMRLIIEGIGHADFSDQVYLSPLRRFSAAGSVPRKRVARILGAYVLAFFQRTLCDIEGEILSEEARPFPEASLKIWRRETVANCPPVLVSLEMA
jgi:dienelactone hydrolase